MVDLLFIFLFWEIHAHKTTQLKQMSWAYFSVRSQGLYFTHCKVQVFPEELVCKVLSESLPPGELSVLNPFFHVSSNSNRLPVKCHELGEPLSASYSFTESLIVCDLWSVLGKYETQRNVKCTCDF